MHDQARFNRSYAVNDVTIIYLIAVLFMNHKLWFIIEFLLSPLVDQVHSMPENHLMVLCYDKSHCGILISKVFYNHIYIAFNDVLLRRNLVTRQSYEICCIIYHTQLCMLGSIAQLTMQLASIANQQQDQLWRFDKFNQ